jgi:pimeloyl-ACP methyl ester carboxylesterase
METARSRDGTPIAFERVGAGSPLVLVHGATADRTHWRALLPLLAPHVRACPVDRRGRGGSGDTPPYAVEREVEDIVAVVDALRGPVSLVGHSSGAILALQAAPRIGDRLHRLVLYEPPIFFGADRRPADLADRLDALLAAGDREAVVRTFLREGPGRTEAQIAQMQRAPRWPEFLALAHTLAYDARVQGTYVFDPDRLRAVSVPTLVLLGGASPPDMAAGMEALAAALPQGEIALLPGQEHSAHVTAPHLVAHELLRFLSVAD